MDRFTLLLGTSVISMVLMVCLAIMIALAGFHGYYTKGDSFSLVVGSCGALSLIWLPSTYLMTKMKMEKKNNE